MTGAGFARFLARVKGAGLATLEGCRSRTSISSQTRHYSTTENEKLYEHRVYTIQPEQFKLFLDLSTEWMHLRTSHSKLVGYWFSEIGGGIHEVIHIWEYDSLGHRASVRQALAKDEKWISSYLSKLLSLLQRQDNSLLKLVPGSSIRDPPSGGVYQLESFSYNPRKLEETQHYILGRQKMDATQLATFYTVLGVPYFGYQLWHHPNADNLLRPPVEEADKAQDQSKELGVAVWQSRLLLPAPWSTMK